MPSAWTIYTQVASLYCFLRAHHRSRDCRLELVLLSLAQLPCCLACREQPREHHPRHTYCLSSVSWRASRLPLLRHVPRAYTHTRHQAASGVLWSRAVAGISLSTLRSALASPARYFKVRDPVDRRHARIDTRLGSPAWACNSPPASRLPTTGARGVRPAPEGAVVALHLPLTRVLTSRVIANG